MSVDRIVISNARGERGLASGPLGAGSVTAETVSNDSAEQQAILNKLGLAGINFDSGYIGGLPTADELRGSKLEIVCGAVRQDPLDRTRWNFIDDAGHQPVGVTGTYATATGGSLVIPFAKTYSRVVGFVAGPDETFANVKGIHIGASVGLSSATIKANSHFQSAVTIAYSGGAWNIVAGTNQDINVVYSTYSGAGGYAVFNHDYCQGIDATVIPDTASGTINNPYLPVFRTVTNTSFQLQWIDPTTGLVVTGVPSTRMAARFTKRHSGGLHLDGSNGSGTLNLDSGNIWFFGIFEV